MRGRRKPAPRVSLGDIVISLPFAYKESLRLEISFREEIARLLVHSFFHLLGFDHKTRSQKRRMQRMERACLYALLGGEE